MNFIKNIGYVLLISVLVVIALIAGPFIAIIAAVLSIIAGIGFVIVFVSYAIYEIVNENKRGN